MSFEISGHSFRLLNFLHHFSNNRILDIFLDSEESFTQIRTTSGYSFLLDDKFYSQSNLYPFLDAAFRYSIFWTRWSCFTLKRTLSTWSEHTTSGYSFLFIFSTLESFSLERIHTLSIFLGSHLKNKLMNISFETNGSLSSELGHFPFRCIFETNIPAPCTHFSSGLVQTYI